MTQRIGDRLRKKVIYFTSRVRTAIDGRIHCACFLILVTSSVVFPAHASVEIDQSAPSLVVEQLDGKTFDLLALKGRVVIVNFWATWCAPCRQEMPALDAFYRKHHADGIEMIAVSVDRRGSHDEVQDVMKGYSFPGAMFSDISSSGFGMPGAIPITYVVDEKGTVRAILSPDRAETTEALLNSTILPLLPHKNAI